MVAGFKSIQPPRFTLRIADASHINANPETCHCPS
jgi:hypothetical protein